MSFAGDDSVLIWCLMHRADQWGVLFTAVVSGCSAQVAVHEACSPQGTSIYTLHTRPVVDTPQIYFFRDAAIEPLANTSHCVGQRQCIHSDRSPQNCYISRTHEDIRQLLTIPDRTEMRHHDYSISSILEEKKQARLSYASHSSADSISEDGSWPPEPLASPANP